MAGPDTAVGRFLRGLIKLAAAGVKVREHSIHGVRRHAASAGEVFADVAAEIGTDRFCGLEFTMLQFAADRAAQISYDRDFTVGKAIRVFPFVLQPEPMPFAEHLVSVRSSRFFQARRLLWVLFCSRSSRGVESSEASRVARGTARNFRSLKFPHGRQFLWTGVPHHDRRARATGRRDVAIIDGVPPGFELSVEDLLVDYDRTSPRANRNHHAA